MSMYDTPAAQQERTVYGECPGHAPTSLTWQQPKIQGVNTMALSVDPGTVAWFTRCGQCAGFIGWTTRDGNPAK